MAKKQKSRWDRKPCGCVKSELAGESVVIRCGRHQGKPSKRVVCYFGDDGIVRRA